ncbi:tyrosine-type recombinase/integrase [Saccharopolyspora hattusasensis]|uniref:tyrosine-type recombinase/integrase n=1 Tax=Saccharopolyspora hattusasensis TaxID=1128679 RepID=UPI003D95C5F0
MPRKRRPEGTRAPNGTGSIYKGKDGYWHGRVTMGTRDDGRPDRRHVQGKTEADVTRKVRELERQRDSGNVSKAGNRWRLGKWLEHWHEHIAVSPNVRPKTWSYYHTAVVHYLIPGLGAHWMERLQPDHVERLYSKLRSEGKKSSTIQQVHRTLRTALNEACRRGYIAKSPMDVVKAPPSEEREIEPLTVKETQRIFEEAGKRRNGVRFIVALALGIRQGEALAMRWRYVDFDAGTVRIRKALQRRTWQHGCRGACGRKRGAECPKRHGGGLVEVDTKSTSGKRKIGLPEPLVRALKVHKMAQDRERAEAGTEWAGEDWVFAQPNGRPIDPRRDYDEWLDLLDSAGVREARLHDARHTMATMLLVLRIPSKTVMTVMGWSQESMLKRYQHVPQEVLDEVAADVGKLLWTNN